jgi:hypothetical protein
MSFHFCNLVDPKEEHRDPVCRTSSIGGSAVPWFFVPASALMTSEEDRSDWMTGVLGLRLSGCVGSWGVGVISLSTTQGPSAIQNSWGWLERPELVTYIFFVLCLCFRISSNIKWWVVKQSSTEDTQYSSPYSLEWQGMVTHTKRHNDEHW